jgi:hypothetical protein
VRSTTGAYGDFPEYYYKPGNQFGAYRLGRTPEMSSDTRRELGLRDGDGLPVFVPRRTPAGPPRKPTPHEILIPWVARRSRRTGRRGS